MSRHAWACACLVLGLSAAATAQPAGRPPAVPPEQETQRQVAVVAEEYLEVLLAGKADILAALGTDPFTFDGRVVKGRQEIMRTWQRMLSGPAGKLAEQPGLQLAVFDHAKALELFGPAPAKLAHLALPRCMFVAVTFEARKGFLLVLTRNPRAVAPDPRGKPEDAVKDPDEGAEAPWLVTAVTE
ncbi:MAG TPA: hypothetical protein PK668_21925 [Myxococcota bacterium]|nr:hypothetical protein [Myxococcota bacterium]HRY96366.1 hypothetical protein [Myxococcota bacterium]